MKKNSVSHHNRNFSVNPAGLKLGEGGELSWSAVKCTALWKDPVPQKRLEGQVSSEKAEACLTASLNSSRPDWTTSKAVSESPTRPSLDSSSTLQTQRKVRKICIDLRPALAAATELCDIKEVNWDSNEGEGGELSWSAVECTSLWKDPVPQKRLEDWVSSEKAGACLRASLNPGRSGGITSKAVSESPTRPSLDSSLALQTQRKVRKICVDLRPALAAATDLCDSEEVERWVLRKSYPQAGAESPDKAASHHSSSSEREEAVRMLRAALPPVARRTAYVPLDPPNTGIRPFVGLVSVSGDGTLASSSNHSLAPKSPVSFPKIILKQSNQQTKKITETKQAVSLPLAPVSLKQLLGRVQNPPSSRDHLLLAGVLRSLREALWNPALSQEAANTLDPAGPFQAELSRKGYPCHRTKSPLGTTAKPEAAVHGPTGKPAAVKFNLYKRSPAASSPTISLHRENTEPRLKGARPRF
ncbi:uncharacterized protein LOC121301159 [Polyodon spathula]|uniref:uncharacterized protein LOC121301159 n=1 Tax=Polyodon spathula TaxID=7913 RepID=UPI001B7DDDE8|nr:uncharacterized protein LOC121301159 [Polyodon spathula]